MNIAQPIHVAWAPRPWAINTGEAPVPRLCRNAFTLLELLLANVLIAILLGALLLLISSLSREQKKIAAAQQQDPTNSIVALLRSDLSNSESIRPLPNQRGFILTGHAALDSKSLTPTDRR